MQFYQNAIVITKAPFICFKNITILFAKVLLMLFRFYRRLFNNTFYNSCFCFFHWCFIDCLIWALCNTAFFQFPRQRQFIVFTTTMLPFLNPLSANPTKWSNTLKQVVGSCLRIVWVCLTFLWGCHLKG